MEVRSAGSDRFRVVVLSRDPALGSRLLGVCERGVEVARVASGYEAGAEILAAPVAAMVIDFRALSPAHGRLLDVARRMDVAMFGVGPLPIGMSTEELSGIRLVSTVDLPGALDRLAAAAAKAPEPAEAPGGGEAAPPEAPPPTPPVGEPQAPERPRKRRARRKKAAKRTARPKAERETEPDTAAPAAASPAEDKPRPAAPQVPSDLLTPEELTALLENEP